MKTHAWQRTVGALMFLPLLTFLLIFYSVSWLFISFAVYLIIAITITAGYHRYFSHGAYQCSKFWQYFFGYVGSASLNASPIEWASVHINHHKFSDTENDPYDSSWRQFFKFKDREGIKATKSLLLLLKDPVHRFFVKNSAAIAIGTAGLLAMISTELFLFVYALPVAGYLFTSYSHNILAHKNHQPQNLWAMEFIVPMCGEWIHRVHHERPRLEYFNTDPKYFDMGGRFIKLIRND